MASSSAFCLASLSAFSFSAFSLESLSASAFSLAAFAVEFWLASSLAELSTSACLVLLSVVVFCLSVVEVSNFFETPFVSNCKIAVFLPAPGIIFSIVWTNTSTLRVDLSSGRVNTACLGLFTLG